MPQEISPLAAWEKLQNDQRALLLDVRSTVEFHYVGHPLQAIHLPWQEPPAWEVDPDFSNKFLKLLEERGEDAVQVKCCPVLCICRSGKRSLAAATILEEAGFQKVYSIAEGFEGDSDNQRHRNTINGWRYHNLPWEQS